MNYDWMQDIIDKQLEELQSEKKSEYWFSLSSISKVPRIEYPGFTEKECVEVQEQTKNVLRASRNENNYKEVAITYKKDANNDDKEYIKVLGDYTSVFIMKNEKVCELLNISNKNEELVVISIHNHPNDSGFSINDIFIFSENPSIKLMEIVNKNGDVSFLLRPKNIDLSKLVIKNILDIVPDFAIRKKDWVKNNIEKPFQFRDLLHSKEIKQIIEETLLDVQEMGCVYSKYLNEETAKEFVFKDSSQKDIKIDTEFFSSFRNKIDIDSLNTDDFDNEESLEDDCGRDDYE